MPGPGGNVTIDVERMAKDLKLPIGRIKAHLCIAPATSEEARERFLHLKNMPHERAETLRLWVSLCRVAQDYYHLSCSINSDEWKSLPAEFFQRWIQCCEAEIESADTFSKALVVFHALPHHGLPEPDIKRLRESLIQKAVRLCETASDFLKAYGAFRDHQKCFDVDSFLNAWMKACSATEDVISAYESTARRHDTFIERRIGACGSKEELRKLWREVCNSEFENRQRKESFEGPYVRKMAQFYQV